MTPIRSSANAIKTIITHAGKNGGARNLKGGIFFLIKQKAHRKKKINQEPRKKKRISTYNNNGV